MGKTKNLIFYSLIMVPFRAKCFSHPLEEGTWSYRRDNDYFEVIEHKQG